MSDLIKREDAIKAYNEAMEELVKWQMEEWLLGDFSECEFNTTDCKHIVRKLEAIPSADIPQGEWIAVASYSAFGGSEEQWYAHGNPTAYHYCSVCKEQVHLDEFGEEMLTNFCPNCGARMKGADDEC